MDKDSFIRWASFFIWMQFRLKDMWVGGAKAAQGLAEEFWKEYHE